MIMECTDCDNCANFDFGYRLVCLCPTLSPGSVYDYQPLGDKDADDCIGFTDGVSQYFSISQLVEAESSINGEEEWEVGVRSWCDDYNKEHNKNKEQ